MSKERNKSGFIIWLLIVIIVILATLCVLFATGTISFYSNDVENNEINQDDIGNNNFENNNITDNNGENNNVTDDNVSKEEFTTQINNKNVEPETLNYLLKALGIASSENEYGKVNLSDDISNSNYQEKAGDIIVSYAVEATGNVDSIELPEDYDRTKDDACLNSVSCAIISEEKAKEIIRLYNFKGEITDYFYKSSLLDNMYGIHFGGTLVRGEWNGINAGISHDVISENIDSTNIKITDNQTIKKYNLENPNTIVTTIRNVTYNFKKDAEGNYYLDSVEIK